MCEGIYVLVNQDDNNKIYFVEEKSFVVMSKEANKALADLTELWQTANENGYKIVKLKRTKSNSNDASAKIKVKTR